MPLFTKSQLSKILNTNMELEAASPFIKEIKMRMRQDILRCVIDCPVPHLAGLACGTQAWGVAFDATLTDFKIIFENDDENGFPDAWNPKAMSEFHLPDLPALGETAQRPRPSKSRPGSRASAVVSASASRSSRASRTSVSRTSWRC